MCALTINDENKIDFAVDDNMMKNVITLLNTSDPRCLRHAMGCLANLSERHDTHPYLRKHKVHSLVLRHFDNDDVALLRETSRLITNMSAVHESHPLLVGVGVIHALVKGCSKRDALVTRFCALGLMNLSTLPDHHRDLMLAKCYNVLIELAASSSREWTLLDSVGEPENKGTALLSDAQPPSDSEANKVSTPRSLVDWQSLEENGYDKDSRRYAVLAIGNLSLSTEYHNELVNEESINAIKLCMQSDDSETRFNAAFAMNKITLNEGLLKEVGSMGVIPLLVHVLSIGDVDTVAQAAGALRHLALCHDNHMFILESGMHIIHKTDIFLNF